MHVNNKTLSIQEAYAVALNYLEKKYRKTGWDDLGSLLGDMQLLGDGISADSAAREDWFESANNILNKNKKMQKATDRRLTLPEAYEAMINFLSEYANRTHSDQISEWLKDNISIHVNRNIFNEWNNSVNEVIKNS